METNMFKREISKEAGFRGVFEGRASLENMGGKKKPRKNSREMNVFRDYL